MDKKNMSVQETRLREETSDWFTAQFEMDDRIKAAMLVIESVHFDEETDEKLQCAMYDIIGAAADIAADTLMAGVSMRRARENRS